MQAVSTALSFTTVSRSVTAARYAQEEGLKIVQNYAHASAGGKRYWAGHPSSHRFSCGNAVLCRVDMQVFNKPVRNFLHFWL